MLAKTRLFKTLEQEMKRAGFVHLARETGLSRQTLHDMVKTQSPRLDSLLDVVDSLGFTLELAKNRAPSKEVLYSSLHSYGAPLLVEKALERLPLEEALAWGVVYSREDALLVSVVPYVLGLQVDSLDVAKLFALTSSMNQTRALGYLCDVASQAASGHPKLATMAQLLFSESFKLEPLNAADKVSPRRLKAFELVNNEPAKLWKFLTLDELSYHVDRYEKWSKQAEERRRGRERHNSQTA